MNRFTGKTIALIVVLIALGVSAWFLFGNTVGGIEYANADRYTAGDATVTDRVENLLVDWTAGEVSIAYHSGSGIIITETANKALDDGDKLRWWLDGTTLRIRYAKAGLRFSFGLEKKLTVSLPEGMVLKSADISSTSGNLKIPALAAEEIRLGSTSGGISAVTSAAKKLSASSTSGGIALRQDDDADTVELHSTSGGIACTLNNVKTVTGNATSGGIALSIDGKAGTVKLGSTSGTIALAIASADTVETAATSGNVTGSVASFTGLKAGSTSGSITLQLPAEPGFTCKAETTSGDFSSGLPLTKNGDTYTCGDGSAVCSIGTTSGNIRIDPLPHEQ